MNLYSPVIVSLQNPKEKIWGVLLALNTSGVTVRGIDLNSFEDWSRQVANGEETMGLSTVFVPMHRVERVHLDETLGEVSSYAATFKTRVGKTVHRYLDLEEPASGNPAVLQFRPQPQGQEPAKPPRKKPGR